MDQNERLGRIEVRLDSIDDNLDRHMKRSDSIEEQVQPMKELMIELKGFYKILKLLALLAAILEAYRVLK